MVKKLRMLLDYRCWPVWLYDENGRIIDTILPEELRDDESLQRQFDALQDAYDALFIDDGHVFDYRGFRTEEEKEAFVRRWKAAVAELAEKTAGRYEIVDDLKLGLGWE